MTYANLNHAPVDGRVFPQRGSLDQRRSSPRKCRERLVQRPTQVQRKRPATSYFELLMSLPARATLPELMQAAAS
jgi:hypothetical protein